MKITKKVSMQGDWAKVGEDIVDGGTITILNEGKEVDGDYGKRLVFTIKTKNGEKIMTFNQTSLNNLVDAYGDDSNAWKDEMAKTYVVKQKVGDKLKNVAYICGIGWDMLDDGQFVKNVGKKTTKSKTEDEPDNDDYDSIPVVE